MSGGPSHELVLVAGVPETVEGVEMKITVIIMLAFAVGAGATVYLYERQATAAERERLEILKCWHEVATSRRLNPGECRFL